MSKHVRWIGNSQGHSGYRIPIWLRLPLFLFSLKDPPTWGFIFCNVCVLIIMKPAQLFPESRDVPLSRRVEESGGWRPGLVVCMFFFWQALGRDAFYSLKCLESVPFPLQSVSFHCSAVSVFAWKPEGKGQLLWPCESRFKAGGKGGESCGPLRHKQLHVYLQTLKDRHVCWRPFITQESRKRLP